MNIFITDSNPLQCAKALDDKRLNKMITESAQLLSTAIYCNVINKSNADQSFRMAGLCKPSHINHPCNKWARETRSNFLWLYSHYLALYDEWRFRFKKEHKGFTNYAPTIFQFISFIPDGRQTEFPNCSGFQLTNVFDSYRMCLVTKWKNDKRKPKWTNRDVPRFYEEYEK